MAEIELDLELSGVGSLDDDLNEYLGLLKEAVTLSTQQVQDFMQNYLQMHIFNDVYKVYSPKVYPRRVDNPQFGEPIISETYMDKLGPVDRAFGTREINLIAGLDYNPRGEHSGTTADINPDSPYYNSNNPKPLKPNPVHENDLIRRIETGKGYDWDVPPKVSNGRPFWQNFVNGMIDGGLIGSEFLNAMQQCGVKDLEMAYDEVEREPNDGDY